ncbi:hypothetical protein RRG08_062764 [Elysia crispata]|uniref:Uncharacterized protein n=1 Tax=Elysia crispata TaxID=231223 RepID=A0AAE1E8S8_9GAST|nr:hypothetical protein RRG08_062764 [Elysia crispata]
MRDGSACRADGRARVCVLASAAGVGDFPAAQCGGAARGADRTEAALTIHSGSALGSLGSAPCSTCWGVTGRVKERGGGTIQCVLQRKLSRKPVKVMELSK